MPPKKKGNPRVPEKDLRLEVDCDCMRVHPMAVAFERETAEAVAARHAADHPGHKPVVRQRAPLPTPLSAQ